MYEGESSDIDERKGRQDEGKGRQKLAFEEFNTIINAIVLPTELRT